jgi:hypothetical protein
MPTFREHDTRQCSVVNPLPAPRKLFFGNSLAMLSKKARRESAAMHGTGQTMSIPHKGTIDSLRFTACQRRGGVRFEAEIDGLAQAAQRISSVVDLIRAIAAQTNLLALSGLAEHRPPVR